MVGTKQTKLLTAIDLHNEQETHNNIAITTGSDCESAFNSMI